MYSKKDKYKHKYLNLKYGGNISNIFPIILSHESKYDRGVFATHLIPIGGIIEIAPCITDFDSNFTGKVRDYIFKNILIEGHSVLVFGLGSFYNHDDEYNADYSYNNNLMTYTATRVINPQEEIFINYGPSYWDSRTHVNKN